MKAADVVREMGEGARQSQAAKAAAPLPRPPLRCKLGLHVWGLWDAYGLRDSHECHRCRKRESISIIRGEDTR